MRFSRLRLLGFKSFVEPSDFVIEGGLTGVVGPNGCGKSNLVEALRWVMGESSYKNMRASGMDDVIFSGSATRPSRNTAEVTLFLENADRPAPAAFNDSDELQVSRRIEREAGSVYRINGKDARARDVQLLFADQSTGARSPSMVGQGRIGELIQAKPQARRALLEEAAGISGLHSRRHEAELRLRAAEQNLERLDDVVAELESQIDSLKRQARQATRFKNVSAEIRKSEAILLHLRWTQAKEHEAEAQSALAQATSLVAEKAAAQAEAAKRQGAGAHDLPSLRDAEAKAAAALERLTITRAQLNEEAERLRNRRVELEKRLEQLGADIKREKSLLSDSAGMIERLGEEETALHGNSSGSAEREAETRAAHERTSARLAASEEALASITAERAEASADRDRIERGIRDLGERKVRLDGRLTALESELAKLAEKISGLPDPAEKAVFVERLESDLARNETEVNSAERSAELAREKEQAARAPLQDAKAELAKIETESRTLAKILNADAGGLFPAVLENIRVERGFETALGAALGEDLDIPLDMTAPAHWAGAMPMEGDPELPAGVISLASVVKAPAELSRRLAQTGVIEGDDTAGLRERLRPGQRIVSRDGALWRWDGFVAGADAPIAAAQRLARKNRLTELDAKAVHATKAVRGCEAKLEEAKTVLQAAIARERETRDKGRELLNELKNAREALASAERTYGQFATKRAALEESKARLIEARDEATGELAAAESSLANAPDLVDLKRRRERANATVLERRASAAEARATFEGLSREVEARNRRLEAIAVERGDWTGRADTAKNQVASLETRTAEANSEIRSLADAPDEVETRQRALMNQLSEAEKLRRQAADRLQEAENRQVELDRTATDAITALARSREERARAEERLTAADERRVEVEARIKETINVAPHIALGQAGLGPDADLPDANDVERRLERLKIERERLGAVNLRAEAEQAELSERLDTIATEREDVIEAIRNLRKAIQNLNKEGRERLLQAFGVVDGHFRRLFTHLFGGGAAELQLIESEDPLEAGLEILARPPGKRPQTMTLLSGGEQALTAMALIFAVFLTNPAPICVLDEVDAPLDDHNVERFCNLMDEMVESTDTRFVIITHNPITMARMNRLYGVTMGEQGVSQLVSVNLEQAEELREAG